MGRIVPQSVQFVNNVAGDGLVCRANHSAGFPELDVFVVGRRNLHPCTLFVGSSLVFSSCCPCCRETVHFLPTNHHLAIQRDCVPERLHEETALGLHRFPVDHDPPRFDEIVCGSSRMRPFKDFVETQPKIPVFAVALRPVVTMAPQPLCHRKTVCLAVAISRQKRRRPQHQEIHDTQDRCRPHIPF